MLNTWRGFQRFIIFKKWIQIYAGLLVIVASASAQVVPKDAFEQMRSDQFKIREQGLDGLKKWANNNLKQSPELLYKRWSQEVDPEVKVRCFSVMKDAVMMREFGDGPGFLGVSMEAVRLPLGDNNQEIVGVKIRLVMPDTPAAKAGLLFGDVVLKIDQLDFNVHPNNLMPNALVGLMSSCISAKKAGDMMKLEILRGKKKIDVEVKLITRPEKAKKMGNFALSMEVYKRKKDLFFSDWLKKMSR